MWDRDIFKYWKTRKNYFYTKFSIVCIETNRTSSRGTQLTWFEVDLTWFWNLRDFDFVLKLKNGIKWENVLALLSIKKTKVSMSSSSNDISFACKSKVHETKDLTIHLVKFLWTFFYSFIYLSCPSFLKILYLSINKKIIIIIYI